MARCSHPNIRVRARLVERRLAVPTFTGHLATGEPFILIDTVWGVLRDATIARWRAGSLVWWPAQQHNTIDIVIGIDKGGRSTKLQALWLNAAQPQSSQSALLLGLYEGDDDYERFADCFRSLLRTLAELDSQRAAVVRWRAAAAAAADGCAQRLQAMRWHGARSPARAARHTVNFYYNGDTVLLNMALGLSGHSSIHPCPMCTVQKAQLQWRAGSVHSFAELGDGAPALRTLDSLAQHHDDFVTEHGSERKRARHHQNVIHPSLIATEINGHIAPPVLHIVLGMALQLYRHFDERCIAFDAMAPAASPSFIELLRAAATRCNVYFTPPHNNMRGDGAHRFIHNGSAFVGAMRQRAVGADGAMVGEDDAVCDRFVELLAEFDAVAALMLVDSQLCDHAIDSLQQHTATLARQWHACFSRRQLTPKAHMLFCDVPRFAHQHRMVNSQLTRLPSPPCCAHSLARWHCCHTHSHCRNAWHCAWRAYGVRRLAC